MNNKLKLENLTSYLVPAASLLLGIILVPVLILPQWDKIAESSQIIDKNKDRLESLETKQGKLEDLANEKDQIEADLALIETVLPINKDVAALVLGIQTLARNNGLTVSTFKIQPGKTATDSAGAKETATTQTNQKNSDTPASTKENLVFNMGMTGTLKNLQSFVTLLEKGKRILTMSQLRTTTDGGPNYNIDIFINAPFNPLPKLGSDPAAKPLAELTEKNLKLLKDLSGPIFNDITGQDVDTGPTGPQNPFRGN